MARTAPSNKARSTVDSKTNPTVDDDQAAADATTETRTKLGIGPTGVWGADDGLILSEATIDPTTEETTNPEG